MESRHSNPAVYAGIVGAAAYAVPTYAHAVEVFGADVPLSEASVAFIGGCVSGAIVATGVNAVINLKNAQRDEAGQVASIAAHSAAAHASTPKHAQVTQDTPKGAKHIAAPITMGDVVVANVLDTDVDVVASMDVDEA